MKPLIIDATRISIYRAASRFGQFSSLSHSQISISNIILCKQFSRTIPNPNRLRIPHAQSQCRIRLRFGFRYHHNMLNECRASRHNFLCQGTGAGRSSIYLGHLTSAVTCSIRRQSSPHSRNFSRSGLDVLQGFDLGLGNVRVDETQHASSTRLELQPISSALDGSPNPLSFRADFHW